MADFERDRLEDLIAYIEGGGTLTIADYRLIILNLLRLCLKFRRASADDRFEVAQQSINNIQP